MHFKMKIKVMILREIMRLSTYWITFPYNLEKINKERLINAFFSTERV